MSHVTTVNCDSVNGVVDCSLSLSTTDYEQAGLTSSSEPSLSSETSASTALAVPAAEIKHEQLENGSETPDYTAEDRTSVHSTGDYKSEERTGMRCSDLALILKLQRDMATMQLQLSNLQDAMRTANATLQQLLQQAFDSS